jgi:hypothetical protein
MLMKIRVDPHYDPLKSTQKLDTATLTMSLFSQSNPNKFITHTPLPLERIDQDLIVYPF